MTRTVAIGRFAGRRRLPRVAGAGWALLPLGLLMAGVLVGPLYVLLQYAFAGGLQDWRDFLDAPAKVDALVRTLVIAGETTVLCAVIGYVYAGALVDAGARLRAVLLAVVLLPFLTSILVRTYGWIVVLGNQGPINQGLRSIAGEGASISLLYDRTGLMIGMVHVMLPFFVLPLYAVWSQVPRALRRAARALGANPVEAFLRVELPLTIPGAAAGMILVFITSLGFFITPSLLGGQGDVMVSQIIDRELTASVDLNDAAVLGTVLLAATLVVLFLFRLAYPVELLFVQDAVSTAGRRRRLAGALSAVAHRGGGARALRVRLWVTAGLGRLPWRVLAMSAAGLVALYLATPLLIVLPVSLIGEPYLHFPPDSLSLRWFEAVAGDPAWRRAAWNSLVTAIAATAITLAVGLPVAFAIARGGLSPRLKGAVMVATTLPVIVPLVVLALAVYAWFLEARLVGNLLALACAHALLGLPFLVIIVAAALRDFDVRLERASRSLGAGAWTTLRLVTLPLLRGAILAGLLFAFLQSFDELLIARAVTDVETQTLPVKMWNGANQEISPALGAVSVLSLAITMLAAVLLAGVRKTTGRRR